MKNVLSIIFLICSLSLSGQIIPYDPDTTDWGTITDTIDIDINKPIRIILAELGCIYIEQEQIYECGKLPAFQDYEWEHFQLRLFAKKVINTFLRIESILDEKTVYLAIRGTADAKEITEFKNWDEVNIPCQNREGVITNFDLATLRACAVKLAIESEMENIKEVKLLESFDFSNQPDKIGNQYKSAIFYLIIN